MREATPITQPSFDDPSTPSRAGGSARAILSLDIGGTKLAAALLTRDGVLISKRRADSLAHEGPGRMLERLVDLAHGVLEDGGAMFDAAGVSCPGPLDPVSGTVLSPPNLPGWDRVPLRERLAGRLSLDPSRVHIENDANACALAEHLFGAARGKRHALFLTMSTGIGGGMILDGRLHRGARLLAGEVGHLNVWPGGPLCGCGRRGCLEAVASGAGIAARLRELFESLPEAMRRAAASADRITAQHLFDAARTGDPWAVRFLDETVDLLARGIANLVLILDPEIVILGTLARHAGDLILSPLRERVYALCGPSFASGLEIVASPLGSRLEELSGLAAALAAEAGCPPLSPPP